MLAQTTKSLREHKWAVLCFVIQLFFKRSNGGPGERAKRRGGREMGKRISRSNNPLVFSKVKSLRGLQRLGEWDKLNVTSQGQQLLTLSPVLALGGSCLMRTEEEMAGVGDISHWQETGGCSSCAVSSMRDICSHLLIACTCISHFMDSFIICS